MTTITSPGGSGEVPAGGILVVDGPVGEDDVINFYYERRSYGTASTLVINDVTTFKGRIENFFEENTITFAGAAVTALVVNPRPDAPPPANGLISALVKVFSGATQIGAFVLVPTVGDGWFVGDTFTLAPNGSGGLDWTTSHSRCFAAGTRLSTPRGEVAVEALAVGDEVVTCLGHGPRRVRWIGRREVVIARHSRPWDVAPIRVCADAFGPGRPGIDVVLSPDHAVHFAGRLIPIRYLENGATILRDPATRVTYYHVELAGRTGAGVHDVVLASGLPVESFLDTDDRASFANGGVVALHTPDFARQVWDTRGCAPLIIDGPHHAAARRYLLRQARSLGHELTPDPAPRLLFGSRCLLPEVRPGGFRFRLQPSDGRARLVSSTFVPAHTRLDNGDWRRLGIGVISLLRDGQPVDLGSLDAGDGWHEPEPGCRWTTGETVIDCAGTKVIDIVADMSARYWAAPGRADTRVA